MNVEELIPHRGPARLLDRVVEWRPGELVGLARVPVESPLVRDGRAPAVLGIEMAAQAAAALEALGSDRAGGPRIGYLVRIQEARFASPDLPAGEPLRVTVHEERSLPPLAIYEITVESEGRPLVTGKLSTYVAADT